jgi:hypothetical protein
MDERELANRLLDLADRTAYENGAQRVASIPRAW